MLTFSTQVMCDTYWVLSDCVEFIECIQVSAVKVELHEISFTGSHFQTLCKKSEYLSSRAMVCICSGHIFSKVLISPLCKP